jgi:vitamin B12 transporter
MYLHSISGKRQTLKRIYFYITIFISLPLSGQISYHQDTIKINEVVISGATTNSDLTGYARLRIDSSILASFSHSTLADLLSQNSKVFVKSYGLGGTATPSLRGMGASQTQLTWNMVNINQPMLGQSDLSLVPAGLIDDINIYLGGASMALNSGGIGGIISLETKPIWKKETLILLNPGMGSFGQYTGLAKVKSGTLNFQSVTKAFFQTSENDFRYLNSDISTIPVWQTRTNSQFSQKGFIQELYYRKEKNVFSARIWYDEAHRNLPASLLTQQDTGEKQFDESLRTMLNYEGFKLKYQYFFTGALLLNRLNYFNRLASVDSRNYSETIILKGEIERFIGKETKLRMIINNDLSVVKSNNYDHYANRNSSSLAVSAERKCINRFGYLFLIREILDKNAFLIPDFSTGFQFRLTDRKEYYLKANFSRNSKIPTMNDIFWMPGGNTNLKNEYSFSYELSYEMIQKISSPSSFKYDLTIFRNSIHDLILWHPGEYSYWTADNIQKANSLGLESSISIDYSVNKIKSSLNAFYSFTRSVSGDSNGDDKIFSGNQLIYVPVNQGNVSIGLFYRKFYSSWIANMTGRRFTTSDNSKYLPGYFLNNLLAGIKLNRKGNIIDMNFKIDNLFNVNYQAIAYYPLPGRSFSLKFLLQIIK